MFASSVLYPLDFIGGRLGFVMRLNPMTWIIDAYRSVFFGLPMNHPVGFIVIALLSGVALAAAWLVFHRSEYLFAESL
jgi:ABC-type polysaccharide/polyol phosphate export permease